MESAESKETKDFSDSKFNQEIHSQVVRAGKRTYFFDVKATRNDEYYLTITESKKKFSEPGKFHYEKHKIFLYREDFEKFIEGLQEVVGFITRKQPEPVTGKKADAEETEEVPNYTDVDFEDI